MATYDTVFEFYTAQKVWLQLDVGIKKTNKAYTNSNTFQDYDVSKNDGFALRDWLILIQHRL